MQKKFTNVLTLDTLGSVCYKILNRNDPKTEWSNLVFRDDLSHVSTYQGQYRSIYDRIQSIISQNSSDYTEGKHVIDPDNFFFLIQTYKTQPIYEKKWESHRQFIDVHLMLVGQETIAYSPISELQILKDYEAEKDVIIYHDNTCFTESIHLVPNQFVVFFPEDGHKPGIMLNIPETIKKCVLKITV